MRCASPGPPAEQVHQFGDAGVVTDQQCRSGVVRQIADDGQQVLGRRGVDPLVDGRRRRVVELGGHQRPGLPGPPCGRADDGAEVVDVAARSHRPAAAASRLPRLLSGRCGSGTPSGQADFACRRSTSRRCGGQSAMPAACHVRAVSDERRLSLGFGRTPPASSGSAHAPARRPWAVAAR